MHEQSIVDLLRQEGPMSRATIARRCRLSKPTVSTIVPTLLAAALVVEGGRDPSKTGRPGRLLAFNGAAGNVVGIDVGGTTTRAVLADLEGTEVASLRVATERGSAPKLCRQVATVVDDLATRAGVSGRVVEVAVCTPGVVDRARRRVTIAPNLPAVETPGFLDLLEATVGTPLTWLNDVNAATLGELQAGAGRGMRDLVYVNVGTGLGLGLVMDGALHEGVGGRGGEFGLLPYPPHGATTLEDALSGRGLADRHLAAGGSGDPADAFHEADLGREPGVSLVTRLLDDLVWTIVAVATLIDPQRVVLGGGIGMRCAPRLDALRAAVAHATGFDVDVVVAQLGDDAGLAGTVARALEPARSVDRWLTGGPLARTA